MKATVLMKNAHGSFSARTENKILLVFSVLNGVGLALGDELEVDMAMVMTSQVVIKSITGESVSIRLERNNIHDLNLPAAHCSSRTPSPERMAAPNHSLKADGADAPPP